MKFPQLLEKERILIKVKTNSQKTEILSYSMDEDVFLVAVKALPIDGKANEEIEKYFSKLLKKNVTIKSGHTSKKKMLVVN
ncbi:DUF167 domain-containing protein [Candidatus Woesearchaeota archaeon]|nr:DUF167 domain-containing protein [Candidatus Woesearchaeota archaeon]